MFCYIYGDYFGLYVPGKLSGMIHGDGPMGHVIQSTLIIPAILLAVPALMVFFSLVLPAAICRWSNVVLGAFYIAVMALTMPGAWAFYILLGVIEIALGCSRFGMRGAGLTKASHVPQVRPNNSFKTNGLAVV